MKTFAFVVSVTVKGDTVTSSIVGKHVRNAVANWPESRHPDDMALNTAITEVRVSPVKET